MHEVVYGWLVQQNVILSMPRCHGKDQLSSAGLHTPRCLLSDRMAIVRHLYPTVQYLYDRVCNFSSVYTCSARGSLAAQGLEEFERAVFTRCAAAMSGFKTHLSTCMLKLAAEAPVQWLL